MNVGRTHQAIDYFVHESSYIDEPCTIGKGTKIWHFCHVLAGAKIGENCTIGQNCLISGGAIIGNNVKVQNNVSIYDGVIIEDDVFLGPSCVLTNISNPRSQIVRRNLYETTILRRGCTIGANSTIVCGVTIGRYAFVAAGSVVTKDIPDYGFVVGNPGRLKGWMSRHGHRLITPDAEGLFHCPESGYRYCLDKNGNMICLDLPEEAPLPIELAVGQKCYRDYKKD